MRLNEHIAISTPKVLLVPYDAHHVPRYHEWMQDPAIQEATASEPLTLEEEFENQQSWRTSHDKLTFIVCKPLDAAIASSPSSTATTEGGEEDRVYATAPETDAPARMVGDVNLFLTPWEDADDDEGPFVEKTGKDRLCNAEVDIMIADAAHRGQGMGRAAVAALLEFVRRNLDMVMEEYEQGEGKGGKVRLKNLVAKIKADNTGSIALFRGLGFRQSAEANYFGEIEMRFEGFGDGMGVCEVQGYREWVYDRSRLV
ncbi:acetyltransferase domain-containing protein [Camillea tinctor]|nr:acetyltransferase domain-containing protein [Camillea tinctor]